MKRWLRPRSEGPDPRWHWTSGPSRSAQGNLLVACGRSYADIAGDIERADSSDVPLPRRCPECQDIYTQLTGSP